MNSYNIFSKNKSELNGIVHINPDGEFVFNDTYNICNSVDIAFFILRSKRNKLLLETDWWVLPDRTPTQAQLDYRESLRNLPANSPNAALDEQGQLINVTWPEMPQ